jgi:GT2 family glycosyltransferase
MVSGPVLVDGVPDGDYPTLGEFLVDERAVVAGRWVRPWRVAGGISTIRRSAIERLGGWDERFGAGTPDFPGSEDMDFNYRLTRSGERVLLTPRVRVAHDQWRSGHEAVAVYAAYNRAWGGLVVKQLRTGDPLGAAMLAAGRLRGIWKIAKRGLLDRSSRRLAQARAELRGFLAGAAKGMRRSW